MAKYKFYIDDTEVSLGKLLEVLGVDLSSIPKRNVREFEINPERVSKDDNGNPKFPKSTGVGTKFTAYSSVEKRYMDVRIAENVRKIESKSGFRNSYTPSQIFFHGRTKDANNEEEYNWMFIHPDAEGSPFRKQNAKWRYRFIDKLANATSDLAKESQRTRAMALIVGDNAYTITQLKTIAKGLGINGVDDLHNDEIRVALRQLAIANPVLFYEQCKDRTVIFNGLVQDAIDQNILVLKTYEGMRRWFFEEEEITIVPSTSDSVKIIRDAISQRAQELVPRLKDAIDGKTSEQILKSPALDGLFDDFVRDDDSLPAIPASKEVINAAKEASKQRDREEKLDEYIKLLDLPDEEKEKLHHAKKQFLENNMDEIIAHKAKIEAMST